MSTVNRILLAVLLLASSACSTMNMTAQPPEEALRERVEQMMQAKTEEKWDIVYDLCDHAYRDKVSKEEFLKRKHNIGFVSYAVDQIAIKPSGAEADVTLKLDMLMMGFLFEKTPTVQQWVKEDGKWYFVMKDPGNPFDVEN
ncbi:MAG: hypothetical protein ACOY4H_08890 [Thermodesulfobacteriota bacterium]